MIIFLFILAFTVSLKAQVLAVGSLILTHTSRYYHTNPETILATQELARNHSSLVYALAQVPLVEDLDWYGPKDKSVVEVRSRAGEHRLSFPALYDGGDFELWVAGGYLSACLGRTLVQLAERFVFEFPQGQKLIIHLPMRAIYTGFKDGLIPQTPYLESILDISVDGLNLHQVFMQVKEDEWAEFLKESIEIFLYKKTPLLNQQNFTVEVTMKGERLFSLGEVHEKIVQLSFE